MDVHTIIRCSFWPSLTIGPSLNCQVLLTSAWISLDSLNTSKDLLMSQERHSGMNDARDLWNEMA